MSEGTFSRVVPQILKLHILKTERTRVVANVLIDCHEVLLFRTDFYVDAFALQILPQHNTATAPAVST